MDEEAIQERCRRHWAAWFPHHAPPTDLSTRLIQSRPRTRLYLTQSERTSSPAVLAKVRLADPVGSSAGHGGPRRPALAKAEPLTAEAATAREGAGLRSIVVAMESGDDRFRSARPLDVLADQHTVLMDYVPGRNLRDVLAAGSRVRTRGRVGVTAAGETWHAVGTWLRLYQESTPLTGLQVRHRDRAEVVDDFHRLDDYLTAQVGRRRFDGLGRRAAGLAEDALPSSLPLAAAHHDFAPRNVVIDGEGRLCVIDPLLRWAIPAHEDLCRFLVGVRLLGLQVHTHGLAFDRQVLAEIQRQVVAGYFPHAVPWRQLRAYEALVLLDKWSALTAQRAAPGLRTRVVGASTLLASRFLRQELSQVLEAAESET